MNDYGEKQTSEFNEAIMQLKRLNESWVLCARYRERGMFNELKAKLLTAEIELNYDIKRLNNLDNHYIETLKKINEDIEKFGIEKKRNLVHNKLVEKEMLLREVQEEAGKGMKFQDSDYSELDL